VADNSITRTLARAARAVGGAARLAEVLEVQEGELSAWLDGRREPPTSIYMHALDLVARGPFPSPRRARRRH
jgi:hypothetical protein